jgi:hypothetical protein
VKLLLAVVGLLALAGLAAGCGIPTEATARPIDPNVLPPSLMEQTTTTTTPGDSSGKHSVELFLVSSRSDTEKLAWFVSAWPLPSRPELPPILVEYV